MTKQTERWYSQRLGREIAVARYGHYGTPVLLFPTAGGDAEECERFHLIDAVGQLLAEGRIKVYSLDSIAGRSWLSEDSSASGGARIQLAFDGCVRREVVPLIQEDCRTPDIEIVAAGASIGAFNALAILCRHPDVFSKAICMSGTFDLSRFLHGEKTDEYVLCSPLDFLPRLSEGDHLSRLRSRFALLAHGQGRWEDGSNSWRAADALGARGVPNRVDAWGPEWDHDWATWRAMLPQYLAELA